MSDGAAVDGWFSRLPAAARSALHGRGTTRRYRAGDTLFHEGDLSDWVMVVTAGRVKVSSLTHDGKEVVLAVCPAGELLGELSAIDSGPRSATATALDAVTAQVVSGADFRDFLAEYPAASVPLLRSFCGRLRDSDRRRVEFVAFDSVGRVARELVDLAERFGAPDGAGGATAIRIDLPLTQEELAGMTGSSREATGKALQLFRQRGWIATARRTITVRDLEGLRSRAV